HAREPEGAPRGGGGELGDGGRQRAEHDQRDAEREQPTPALAQRLETCERGVHGCPPPCESGRGYTPAGASARLFRRLEDREILLVAFFPQLLDRYEAQSGRVHAVALAGRRRSVVEDVPEVRVGVRGAHLGPRREQPPVLLLDQVLGLERPREARPAGPGVVLVERGEERLPPPPPHLHPG